MRTLGALLVLACLAGSAAPLQGQALDGVMAAIRNGGGWVSVDIRGGRGSASTLPLPTMGMTLSGCVNVWEGHSGRWRIRARDTVAEKTIETNSVPGQGVTFTHEFGLRSQLEVEFIWSEPRDTTLLLWVGLGDAESDPDVCVPKGFGATR
ncbi:MAG: hypothetical protein FJ207_06120 [Gemmatimonadetes bacterium]|nr:hypothetical protein [Gemmatimonadota bacterium]